MKLSTWKQIDHEMNSLGNEQLLLNTVQTSGVFRKCERRGPRGSGGRKSPSGVQGQSPGRGSGGQSPPEADAFLLLNA